MRFQGVALLLISWSTATSAFVGHVPNKLRSPATCRAQKERGTYEAEIMGMDGWANQLSADRYQENEARAQYLRELDQRNEGRFDNSNAQQFQAPRAPTSQSRGFVAPAANDAASRYSGNQFDVRATPQSPWQGGGTAGNLPQQPAGVEPREGRMRRETPQSPFQSSNGDPFAPRSYDNVRTTPRSPWQSPDSPYDRFRTDGVQAPDVSRRVVLDTRENVRWKHDYRTGLLVRDVNNDSYDPAAPETLNRRAPQQYGNTKQTPKRGGGLFGGGGFSSKPRQDNQNQGQNGFQQNQQSQRAPGGFGGFGGGGMQSQQGPGGMQSQKAPGGFGGFNAPKAPSPGGFGGFQSQKAPGGMQSQKAPGSGFGGFQAPKAPGGGGLRPTPPTQQPPQSGFGQGFGGQQNRFGQQNEPQESNPIQDLFNSAGNFAESMKRSF